MKRMIGMLLAALLALGARAGAEEAVVTFASFDGGGHEYTVEIGDPSILACEVTRDYGGDDPELVDGASFETVCTFTGLAPGSTDVAISGRSPILENQDALYTATVDEALNVTLTPVRALSTFFLYRGGEIYRDSYRISRGPEGYLVSVSDGEPLAIDAASVAALERVVEDYDLERWDGFDESEPNVLDGEGFWLEIRLTDGTHILARGDNAFPEDYFEAMDALQQILDNATIGEEAEPMKLLIGGTEVPVTWEDNDSVAALKALAPLTISMHMYGGFEQVGPIGESLPRNDAQTATAPGDIVLYSGDQIVIFYGSNAWAYTRLGHVDLPEADMARLLGGGDVTVEIE